MTDLLREYLPILVFIGIAFARSLHFQFHLWYWHSMATLLAWALPLPPIVMPPRSRGLRALALAWAPAVLVGLCHIAFAAALEVAWGVHPPTPVSSGAVTLLHGLLLAALLARGRRYAASTRALRGRASAPPRFL